MIDLLTFALIPFIGKAALQAGLSASSTQLLMKKVFCPRDAGRIRQRWFDNRPGL
jgi:hypothetical protein